MRCQHERLLAETNPLLDDRARREAMLDGYDRMRRALGPPDSLAADSRAASSRCSTSRRHRERMLAGSSSTSPSDVHDRRGFGAKLAAIVEPDSLLVDCGDALRGSSTVFRSVEGVMAEFAEAPYKAQAVGNREFHYLHSRMLAARARRAMPWVCSNLVDLRDRAPAPFARNSSSIVGGLRVRLLALLVPQYRTGSGWERDLRLAIPRAGRGARARSAGLCAPIEPTSRSCFRTWALPPIVRSHAYHPELAAIVGGHSHDTLARPEIVDGVPIVQAGSIRGLRRPARTRPRRRASNGRFVSAWCRSCVGIRTMSEPARILLVSNGFGEMAILEISPRYPRREPSASLEHLPLVGRRPGATA